MRTTRVAAWAGLALATVVGLAAVRRAAGADDDLDAVTKQCKAFKAGWNSHDPKAMAEHADEKFSDDDFREQFIIGSDPEQHVERIREVEQLGADVVVLMNNSGSDPIGAVRMYGERVLPALKGQRVPS